MSRIRKLGLVFLSIIAASTTASARIAFSPGERFTVSKVPDHLATGDFNRDGKTDLVVLADRSDEINVLTAGDAGSFRRSIVIPLFRAKLEAVVVRDFNQDGLDDIAVLDRRGRGLARIWVISGRGDGNFNEPAPFITPTANPVSLVAEDLDLDGDIDFALSDSRQRRAIVLVNDGRNPPNFTQAGQFVLAKQPTQVVAGRFVGDSDFDLMILNKGGPRVKDIEFLRNDGPNAQTTWPTFTNLLQIGVGEDPWALVPADVNGDGVTDLAMLNTPIAPPGTNRFATHTQIEILVSRKAGFFDGPGKIPLICPTKEDFIFCRAVKRKENLISADFDKDTWPDFAVTERKLFITTREVRGRFLRIVRGTSGGDFRLSKTFDTDPSSFALKTGDFNGDGWLDIAVAARSNSSVRVFINQSSTPEGNGGPCIDPEDCVSEVCDPTGVCCAKVCGPDETCGVPGQEGTCIPLKGNGDICEFNQECGSGFCVDGVCCEVDSCTDPERCDIFGFEGACHVQLPPGSECGRNIDCASVPSSDPSRIPPRGWCTDGVCCLQEVCPEGDICAAPDGQCITAPTPTPTPEGPGGPCDITPDCQSGLSCVNGVCCTEPSCLNGSFCEPGSGQCIVGTPPPTRTATPTRIPPIVPATPTPTCPPGFRPNGGLCTSVSRGGGCAIEGQPQSGAGAGLLLLLLPALFWVRRRLDAR